MRSRRWTRRRWLAALRGARIANSVLAHLPPTYHQKCDAPPTSVFDPLIVLGEFVGLLRARNRYDQQPPWRYVPDDPA